MFLATFRFAVREILNILRLAEKKKVGTGLALAASFPTFGVQKIPEGTPVECCKLLHVAPCTQSRHATIWFVQRMPHKKKWGGFLSQCQPEKGVYADFSLLQYGAFF